MMRPQLALPAAAAGFLACIVAANWATSHYGLVPVLFGLSATAGTYFAGGTFVLRDTVQDEGGRESVLLLIVVGAALSFVVGSGRIAVASGAAFLLSELADFVVYTPLRRRGYVRAAIASNVVGTLVDTFAFLWLAGFAIVGAVVAGQLVAKLTVTALGAVLALGVSRAVSREPVD
jgi:uncharacterized PurR-regulated membrane protein YhhQ (DUF165 family)